MHAKANHTHSAKSSEQRGMIREATAYVEIGIIPAPISFDSALFR